MRRQDRPGARAPADGGRSVEPRSIETTGATWLYLNGHSCESRRQRRPRRQRALRRRAGAVSIAASEIGERRDHRSLIVPEAAQPEIALPAKQPPYRAGRMAMIDAQRFLRPLSADRAHAALGRQQHLVIGP